MDAFLAEILAFPTAIFTILLGLALLYWLTVIVGVLDLDAFDSADAVGDAIEAKTGALDGAAEAIEAKAGMFDGAAEAIEAKAGVFDGAAEAIEAKAGVFDGAAEAIEAKAGVFDGAAEAIEAKAGALDGVADAIEAKTGAAEAAAMASASQRARVPVTIRFSIFALSSWTYSYLLLHNLAADPATAGLPLVLGAGAGAAVGGWATARLASIPLSNLFHVTPATENRQLVGSECTITTGKVTTDFGQARVRVAGAELVIHVRSEPDRLAKGDRAIIVSFDKDAHAFTVAPIDDFLG